MPKVEVTQYGFRWGCVDVERTTSVGDTVVMMIKTPKETLEIRVTPSGLIRLDNGVTKKTVDKSKFS